MLSAVLHTALLLALQPVAGSVAPPKPARTPLPVMTGRMISAQTTNQATPAIAQFETSKPSVKPELAPRAASSPGGFDIRVEFAYADYLEPNRLTQRPTVLGNIDIPYPELEGDKPNIQVVLTLYINERGIVDRVQVEESGAPRPFVEAAKQAFSSATFRPGRSGDQFTKAKIRVAVDFEIREGVTHHSSGK